MNRSKLYAGGILFLFGGLVLCISIASGNPALGVIMGEFPMFVGGFFVIVGLVSKPNSGETLEKAMKEAIKTSSVLIGFGVILFALVFAVTTPSLRGWGLLIVVIMTLFEIASWFAWIPAAIYWMFAFVYKMVEPKGLGLKVIVAVASIMFGFLLVMMLGGPIGMFAPFWVNLPSSILAIVLIILVGGGIWFMKKLPRNSHKESRLVEFHKKEAQRSVNLPLEVPSQCCLCGRRLTSSYCTCRNCEAAFCSECENERRNLNRCPSCGKLLRVCHHKATGSDYVS